MEAGMDLGKQRRKNVRAVLQYFRLAGETREAATGCTSAAAGDPPESPWLRLDPHCPKQLLLMYPISKVRSVCWGAEHLWATSTQSFYLEIDGLKSASRVYIYLVRWQPCLGSLVGQEASNWSVPNHLLKVVGYVGKFLREDWSQRIPHPLISGHIKEKKIQPDTVWLLEMKWCALFSFV